ncbi:MAG TPA: Spo0E family sporulation regulatory protein-aspartic acid phosphatase [Clostridiaceae bacterium]|nr:Spo0E family sporulation regulatory protein-aspartic acid phosphatase [Clostridiaceae bacterium]
MQSMLEAILSKMHDRLDQLIVYHNYDLQHSEIQEYSKKLDEIILLYTKNTKVQKEDTSN